MFSVEDEEFQDTSRVIRWNKSKDIQYNVQMKNVKRTLIYKPLHKRWSNANSTKYRDWTHVLRNGWESFSTYDTRRVSVENLVAVYS